MDPKACPRRKFADKSEIEDALDAVLRPQKFGCHIGGGTGLRYSYIDLALTDVNRGVDAIEILSIVVDEQFQAAASCGLIPSMN